jgi:hypothetical protein
MGGRQKKTDGTFFNVTGQFQELVAHIAAFHALGHNA